MPLTGEPTEELRLVQLFGRCEGWLELLVKLTAFDCCSSGCGLGIREV